MASVLAVVLAGAGAASAATAPHTVAPEVVDPYGGSVVIDGHGYGHGVGLGQWGALGYAVDSGWGFEQILDHYYTGTVSGTIPSTSAIRVVLVAVPAGQVAVVHDRAAAVLASDPGRGPYRSLVARRTGAGAYTVWGRTDSAVCPSTTSVLSAATGWEEVTTGVDHADLVTATPSDTSTDPSDLLGLCENGGIVRYYRGLIRAVDSSAGVPKTVNEVPMEQYLRSLVAYEMSSSWGGLGGGRGAQALMAQAVAARSYALSDNRYQPYADTCQGNPCQSYRGAASRPGPAGARTVYEFAATDQAVAATTGIVRRKGSPTGPIVLAMFSASSGGYTAPNTVAGFVAVPDDGDAYSGNPSHNWTTTIPSATIQSSWPSIGTLQGVAVTARNGAGEWGGRATTVVISGTSGAVTVTGDTFRTVLALRSTWISIRPASGEPPPSTTTTTMPGTTVPTPTTTPGDPGGPCGADVAPSVNATLPVAPPARYQPLTGARLLDTRQRAGGPVRAGCTTVLTPAVPAGTTAVVVNITTVAPLERGYTTAYACGTPRPLASAAQLAVGRVVPSTVTVPLGADGRLCVFALSTTDLVVDMQGYYAPDAPGGFAPVGPTRVYDSRTVGAPIPGGASVRVPLAGKAGLPAAGATAVAVTVHALHATEKGYVTVYDCGAAPPTASVVNVGAGDLVANHAEVALDGSEGLCVYVSRTMDVMVDVTGWFGLAAPTTFRATSPVRALDTRDGTGLTGAFAAGQNRALQLSGRVGLPSSGVKAVAATVTIVGATSAGFVTVHPCLATVPDLSMVRNIPPSNNATGTVVAVDYAGRWCLRAGATTHLLADVTGWYA